MRSARFAFLIKRNFSRVVDFIFGWYKAAAVVGLSYGVLAWVVSTLFPSTKQTLIHVGLVAGAAALTSFLFLPLIWTVFRNRIARRKSLNPNLAVLEDSTRLEFHADDIVQLHRDILVRPVVTGLRYAEFHISWPGRLGDVTVLSAHGASVDLDSPSDRSGLRITVDFGVALAKGASHRVGYTLEFTDKARLIKPYNAYISTYLAEDKLTIGYLIKGVDEARFRRGCFPSLSSESPLIYDEVVVKDGKHEWIIEYPYHGFRYSLACLSHGR